MFSRTDRLLLRPGWAEDASTLHAIWAADSLAHYLPAMPACATEAEAAAFLTAKRDALHPYLLAFARTGGAPRLVGGGGITPDAQGRPELSFWVARPFWGLGFATETARALTHMARASGLPTLVARPTPGNTAAEHVLRKIGFHAVAPAESHPRTAAAPPVFEDSGMVPKRVDMAHILYRDPELIAA